MDDYSISSLVESKNEWCSRLVSILSPAIIEGLDSIFKEALELCVNNDEEEKYLMTFQTFLTRIPKWNDNIISDERSRIEKSTNCGYLEELISCVHIIQLKALTCVRVGQKQKKIDIDIPSIDTFIHKVYTNVAREVYTNVYLFDKNCTALNTQKNNRELEIIVKEGIMNTIRNTMPVENILKAYIEETEETNVDVKEEIIEHLIQSDKNEETPVDKVTAEEKVNTEQAIVVKKSGSILPNEDVAQAPTTEVAQAPIIEVAQAPTTEIAQAPTTEVAQAPTTEVAQAPSKELVQAPITEVVKPNIQNESTNIKTNIDGISFSNTDSTQDTMGNESLVSAPKTIERLERIALENAQKRKDEYDSDDDSDDDENDKIIIGEPLDLNSMETGGLDEIEVIA